ncbi:MAG: hypothetical protein MK135_08470, partial [Polyangiaceae bacterium]|nr:hypothetical protein [Polyangiaceae bacterium]
MPITPADCFLKTRKSSTRPIFLLHVSDFESWRDSAPAEITSWLDVQNFQARPGACTLLPSQQGLAGVLLTYDDITCPFEFAELQRILPEGSYEVEPEISAEAAEAVCLGFGLAAYEFREYKTKKKPAQATLVWPQEANKKQILARLEGIWLTRDLVNRPANDMGPEELAAVAKSVSKNHQAKFKVIVGESLLKKNFPMIHAVGRASSRAPRLIDFQWGNPKNPLVTLVGKGVCF